MLYSLTAVFFWSTVATAFKLTLEELSSSQLLFYSSSSSAVALGIIAYIKSNKNIKEVFINSLSVKNAVIGLTNPFLYYLILFKAYSLLPAQEAQALNFTWPIMISVFAALFLSHHLSLKTVAGLISAFAGVIIIATRGSIFSLEFHSTLGVILAAGSSLIWATYWIINLKDKNQAHYKLFGAFFFGSIFSAIYIILFDSFSFDGIEYLSGAVYIGFFEMGITFFVWLKGLELSTNKAKTSTLAYLAPFISLIFISAVLGETILLSSVIGLIFIIGGISIQHIKFRGLISLLRPGNSG
ncbi:MAG: DMT family transporter [Melioribacteraceae bacterium]|nr:DMT family transporter [Melioribacteraceae bacterium]